jgi:hypothetical protein
MATILNQRSSPGTNCLLIVVVMIAALQCAQPLFAQPTGFHQTLTVTSAEPVTLDIELPGGDLQVFYSRDGQVSITVAAKPFAGVKLDDQLDESYFKSVLSIDQNGNHVAIRHVSSSTNQEERFNVLYRIDVPYWTSVTSTVRMGQQTISGIMGPVRAAVDQGDIKVSYISKALQAQVGIGNLDLQVIGERADVETRRGNISCSRAAQGVTAVTEDGDITLVVVGPSAATIKKGSGRIEVGGARGSLVASTAAGDIHIKAIPRDDWHLSSVAGNIRLEIPSLANIAKAGADLHYFDQTINGGGARIEAHTGSGNIEIR